MRVKFAASYGHHWRGLTSRKYWADSGSEPSTDPGRSAGTGHSKTSREGLLVLSSRWGDWLTKTATVVMLHVKILIEKPSAGEGLDWQHIRNEFYKAMPESFREVTGIVYLMGRRSCWVKLLLEQHDGNVLWHDFLNMRDVADRMRLVGKVGGWVWAGFCFFQVSVDDCIDAFLASREGLILKPARNLPHFVL